MLGIGLPRDDPGPSARTSRALGEAAERVGVLLRRVGAMLPVQRWSGTASLAADRRLTTVALVLAQERRQLVSAADALARFSAAVAAAQESADEARRLVSSARAGQRSADLRAAATAAAAPVGWGGVRADGVIHDPSAVALLDRARGRAYDARTTYDAAARRLTAELTDLSGRQVVRSGLSPRLLLDVVGLVPVVGDAVDLGNAAAYALQGRWDDAALTAVAAVPGPEGWAAASAKVGKAVSRAGRVERVVAVVDDVPRSSRSRRCSRACSGAGAGDPRPPGRRRRHAAVPGGVPPARCDQGQAGQLGGGPRHSPARRRPGVVPHVEQVRRRDDRVHRRDRRRHQAHPPRGLLTR